MKGHSLPGFKQKEEGNMKTVEAKPKRLLTSDTFDPGAEVIDDGEVGVAREAHDRGRLATGGKYPGESFSGQGADVDIYDIGGKSVAVSNNYRNSLRDQQELLNRPLISDADIKATYGYDVNEEEAILAKEKAKALAEGHKKGADYNN